MPILTGSEPAGLGGGDMKNPNPRKPANPRGVAVTLAFKPETAPLAHKSGADKLAHR